MNTSGANDFVLSIDCGSQSVRALIFDKTGKMLAKTKKSFDYPFKIESSGYFEVPAVLFWDSLCAATQELKQKYPHELSLVKAVTLTTQRNTYIALDADYNPIRPAILWMDERTAACKKPLPLHARAAFTAVGMLRTLETIRTVTKSNWLIENEPENWAKTKHYVFLSGYLIYMMTGILTDSVASQVGYLPFNYKNKKWMSRFNIKREVFNVPTHMLIPLCDVGDMLGSISAKASDQSGIPEGLPLLAAGADKSCETLGTGAIEENVASLSFGTTATVQITTKKYIEPQLFFPAYPSLVHGRYNPEIQYFRGYWMVSWFIHEFAQTEYDESIRTNIPTEVLLEKLLDETPPGCNGLMLRPLWGASVNAPDERGIILGFSSRHKRAHMYRAIVEGIAYAFRDSTEILAKRAKTKIEYATVSGGGSQSDVVCQITADIMGIPLKRIQTYETSGLGAAISAFVSMGTYTSCDDAISKMVRYTQTFTPNPEIAAMYDALYKKAYKKLQSRLRPVNRELHKMFPTD